jgi:hypothetical protein
LNFSLWILFVLYYLLLEITTPLSVYIWRRHGGTCKFGFEFPETNNNNYITSVFHWNVAIWLVMKWSHDYKRDVSHPNETQIRTCTCLHDDVRCKHSMAASVYLEEISRKQWYRVHKQWFKNKVKHKQRAHYISVDLEINRYYFCTEKKHCNWT